MSNLYEEESSTLPVSKTINVNDCMKMSKKFSVNNEQIAKLVKVKEHTKTWIKNVEKSYKTRNLMLEHPVINYDVSYQNSSPQGVHAASTPSMYPAVLPVAYSCSFCKAPADTGTSQYHETLSLPYVLLCTACLNRAR